MYVVVREGQREHLPPEEFWSRVQTGWLRRSDLVLADTGEFLTADRFPALQAYLPRPAEGPNLWEVILGAGAVLGGLWVLGKVCEPTRRPRRRRSFTNAPVAPWKKDYVSVRDGWRCTYCGVRVSRRTRHVDHSVSRANHGTNHLNNLRLACWPCNLEKGPLNARQFVG